MNLLMVSKSGEQHGLIKKLANSVKAEDAFRNMSPDIKGKAEKKQKDGMKMVKARYLNSRGMNERLSLPYTHGAGHPIEQWHFIPGEEYTVPMGLVESVNSSPGLPRRSEIVDAQGVPTQREGPPERLHQFIPLSF